jgi:hypothetical protein
LPNEAFEAPSTLPFKESAMGNLMALAVAWLHGFGGGCFVGLLAGLWIGYGNRQGERHGD